MAERDYLYMHEIISFRVFVSDDRRVGLHLTKANGEDLSLVFSPSAHPDLHRLQILLSNHLPSSS